MTTEERLSAVVAQGNKLAYAMTGMLKRVQELESQMSELAAKQNTVVQVSQTLVKRLDTCEHLLAEQSRLLTEKSEDSDAMPAEPNPMDTSELEQRIAAIEEKLKSVDANKRSAKSRRTYEMHERIMALRINGMRPVDIAKMWNLSIQAVSNYCRMTPAEVSRLPHEEELEAKANAKKLHEALAIAEQAKDTAQENA